MSLNIKIDITLKTCAINMEKNQTYTVLRHNKHLLEKFCFQFINLKLFQLLNILDHNLIIQQVLFFRIKFTRLLLTIIK